MNKNESDNNSYVSMLSEITKYSSQFENLSGELFDIESTLSAIESKKSNLESDIGRLKSNFQRKNQLKKFNKKDLKLFFVEYLKTKPNWIIELYSDYDLIESSDPNIISYLKFYDDIFYDPTYNSKYCYGGMNNISDELLGKHFGDRFLGRSTCLFSEKTTKSVKYNKIKLIFNF